LLLPREFVARYGKPTLAIRDVDIAVPLLIPPDVDRYLFWVIPLGGFTVNMIPEMSDTSLLPASPGDNTVSGIVTYAVHGALVTCGWRITTVGPPGQVVVIQGHMRSNTKHTHEKNNVKPKTVTRSRGVDRRR
jgi:hypothetical protein